jgi:DNA repair protein RecN (Recombination protein N)
VICITHLPQVAAFADAHFLISKELVRGQVKSQVTELKPSERVQELGRMISGEKVTAASLTHAKEMIEQHKTRPTARI